MFPILPGAAFAVASLCPGPLLLGQEMQHVRLDFVRYVAMAGAPTLSTTYSSA